jgi:glycosyltransferase involved in cell wall biosynthesis
MKARIRGDYSKSKIILSIGMIVKNEEKYLEKCLSAIKPLLDAVSSELVIVDTGSIDKTIEIAQKYTDKIYHFDWVNDFSAARNFGLQKCTGQWFMFLDADDIFDDDLSEIIEFFTDKETLGKYNSATYMTKDYTKPDGSEWSMFTQSRIVKRVQGLGFAFPIHEYLTPFPEPTRNLRTFSHHWGYAHETEEQKEAKKQRNLVPLYKELEKTPDNLRVHLHIYADIADEKREELFPEMLKIARKSPGDSWAAPVFSRVIIHYYMKGDYSNTLRYINEYFKIFKDRRNILLIDIYVAMGYAYKGKEQFDDAIKAFESYFRLYAAYIEGKLNTWEMRVVHCTFTEPAEHVKIKEEYDNLLFRTGQRKVSLSESTSVEVVSKHGEQEKPEIESDVSEEDTAPILHALENNTDVTGIIENIEPVFLGKIIEEISQKIFHLPKLIIEYDEKHILADDKNLLFGVLICNTAAKQAGRLPWHERELLYNSFLKYASLNNISVSPEIDNFKECAGNVLRERDNAEVIKNAMDSCKSEYLKWVFELLLEELKS